MKSKLLFAVVCFFSISLSFAQSIEISELNNDWKEISSADGITISVKISDCDFNAGYDEQRILLQVSNANSSDKIVQFDVDRFSNNVCLNCNSNGESHRIIRVAANETISASCSREEKIDMQVYVKFVNHETRDALNKIELNNVIVTN